MKTATSITRSVKLALLVILPLEAGLVGTLPQKGGHMKKHAFGVFTLFLLLVLGQSGLARADAVTVWNANAGVAATAACIAPLADPLHESRIYAMMHVAIHDALNAIDRRSRPYAFDTPAAPGASPEAAVAAAARDVLVPLLGQLPRELASQVCSDAGVASVEAAYRA